MDYFFNIQLLDRVVKCKEISFWDYKNFQKILMEDDNIILESFIDDLISELLISNVKQLSFFEKFIILVSIREYSVSPNRTIITYIDDVKGDLQLDLTNILLKIHESIKNIDFSIDISHRLFNNLQLQIGDLDNVNSYIKACKKDGEDIEFIPEYLNYMDIISYKQILEKILKINQQIEEVELFSFNTEDGKQKNISLSVNKYHLMELIRFFWKDDLSLVYESMFDLKNYLHISFEEMKYFSPVEKNLLVQINNKKIKEEQEKSQKPEFDTGGLPQS